MGKVLWDLLEFSHYRENRDIGLLLESAAEQGLTVDKDQLLNIISEQRTGIIFTPNEISKLMAQIGGLFKPRSIIDPACGLGNLLFYCNYSENLEGYDINPDVIKVAKYINHQGQFNHTDFLQLNVNKKYDLIVCHFPLRKSGRETHYERVFLEKCLDILQSKGTIICIVPDNFLAAPYTHDLRNRILNNFSLEMIINIPRDILPFTFVDSSILVIRKKAQRNTVYLAVYDSNSNQILNNYINGTGELWVNFNELHNRWDRHFHDPRYKIIEEKLRGHNYKALEDLALVKCGAMILQDNKRLEGKYLIFSTRNIVKSKLATTYQDRYVDELFGQSHKESILKEGDIVLSLIFSNREIYFYKKSDPPAMVTHNYALIRSDVNGYIRTYLSSETNRKVFKMQAERKTTGGTIPHLSLKELRTIKIPILELEDPNSIALDNILKANKDQLSGLKEELERLKPHSPRGISTEVNSINLNHIESSIEQVLLGNTKIQSTQETTLDSLHEFRNEILSVLSRLETKIDNILQTLVILASEISTIKSTQRSEEEKLLIIYGKIDRKFEGLRGSLGEELQVYEELLKGEIDDWENLEGFSKEALTLAEYLLDRVRDIGNVDYSPVVIQYCRGLENEILKKLFAAFTHYLGEQYSSDQEKEEFISSDLMNNKTSIFAKEVKKNWRKEPDDIKFTLGSMSVVLNMTSSVNRVQGSPLLTEFKAFLGKQFVENKVLSEKFLNNLQLIVNDFRNKSAHTNKLLEEEAMACKEIVPENINHFLNSCIFPLTR